MGIKFKQNCEMGNFTNEVQYINETTFTLGLRKQSYCLLEMVTLQNYKLLYK